MTICKIGSYLESIRLSRGYSLRTAASLSTLSHGYIRDVELGDTRKVGQAIIPQPQTLRKFAHAYETDFNHLMIIAGHLQNENLFYSQPHPRNEIDLSKILFIRVDEANRVQHHYKDQDQVFYDRMTLNEYMLLEERLENQNFIRVHSGTYVNLIHVFSYDEMSGRIFFDNRQNGKFVDLSRAEGEGSQLELMSGQQLSTK